MKPLTSFPLHCLKWCNRFEPLIEALNWRPVALGIRVHPETDRKALYVNHGFTSHFEGMAREKSLPLLKFPFEPGSDNVAQLARRRHRYLGQSLCDALRYS